MLISSVRFYERILAGLHSSNEDEVAAAQSCLSWFVYGMRNRQLVLPPHIEENFRQLPEVR